MSDSNEATIIGKLKGILEATATEERDLSHFGRSTTIESLGLDSLSFLDVLYDIEHETGIDLAPEDVVSITNMGELIDLLIEKGA